MKMKLRPYQPADSNLICGWVNSETALYQWSADRLGQYPLPGNALQQNYAPALGGGQFYPMCAVDDQGRLVGHLLIRYPCPEDKSTVRFGFVIVDPALRGSGNGQAMLRLAAAYAKETLHAAKVTLGVFANNAPARRCYQAVGFCPVGETEFYQLPIGTWECIEMELPLG